MTNARKRTTASAPNPQCPHRSQLAPVSCLQVEKIIEVIRERIIEVPVERIVERVWGPGVYGH